MIQKKTNTVVLRVYTSNSKSEVDLSNAKNILFCLKQPYGTYIELPAMYEDNKLSVVIPYELCMNLTTSPAEIQLLWTDEDKNTYATKLKKVSIDKMLRSNGYD